MPVPSMFEVTTKFCKKGSSILSSGEKQNDKTINN